MISISLEISSPVMRSAAPVPRCRAAPRSGGHVQGPRLEDGELLLQANGPVDGGLVDLLGEFQVDHVR